MDTKHSTYWDTKRLRIKWYSHQSGTSMIIRKNTWQRTARLEASGGCLGQRRLPFCLDCRGMTPENKYGPGKWFPPLEERSLVINL